MFFPYPFSRLSVLYLAPCTMHHAPRIMHHTSCTTHHAPRTTHHAPRTTHHAPRTTHHAPHIMQHDATCAFRPPLLPAAGCAGWPSCTGRSPRPLAHP